MPNSGMTLEERVIEAEKTLAALRERTHVQNNHNGRDQAIVDALRDIKAAQATTPQPARPADIPTWTKWVAVCGTIFTVAGAIFGVIWTVSSSGAVTTARISTLEAWKIEQTTANMPSRVQNLETGIETARRIRDQQQQSVTDRMRALELADQAGAERINAVLQQLATITAQLQAQASRIEELLRRQDRLENRLGARQGSAQQPDQPTSLVAPRA